MFLCEQQPLKPKKDTAITVKNVCTYVMVDHNSSSCSYWEPEWLTEHPECTLDNNDGISHWRMIVNKRIEEQNCAEQLEAKRPGVRKHEKIICFVNWDGDILMTLSQSFDFRVRYSTFVTVWKLLLEKLVQLFVLVTEYDCEHESHSVWECPRCTEVDINDEDQKARSQKIWHIDIRWDGSQHDVHITSCEEDWI